MFSIIAVKLAVFISNSLVAFDILKVWELCKLGLTFSLRG
jgi:hypothetical protein